MQTSAESNINILRVCETCPWIALNLLALPCASFLLDHLTSESIRVMHFTRYCMYGCMSGGGGVYLPQIWYDTCDALGILVFHGALRAVHSPVT